MGSSTENSAFGTSRNPHDPTRVPGGSSGGSVVAVAASCVPVALGSETGGSVRQPAAFCGTVGVKPTYGRVSRYGLVAFGSSLDQIGTVGTTVEDAALVLSVIAGSDPHDATSAPEPVGDLSTGLDDTDPADIRIGWPAEYFGEGLDPAILSACEAARDRLAQAGAEIVEVSLPHSPYGIAVYYTVAIAEASSNLARYDGVRYGFRGDSSELSSMYLKTRAAFGAELKRRIMLGTYVLSAGYYEAFYGKGTAVRARIRADFEGAFERVDAILTPTTPTPAFPIGEKAEDPLAMYLNDIYTVSANLAGIPAISIPWGRTPASGDRSALPIGSSSWGRISPSGGCSRSRGSLSEARRPITPAPKRRRRAGPPVAERASAALETSYEPVIGLEVHVQLSTASKIFCGCSTAYGAPPNTQICPICLGYPGSLPMLNAGAVELAVRAAIALGCEVHPRSIFARKHYFYPDLPKGYQISQYDRPLATGGVLEIRLDDGGRKTVRITRVHLEEDAGSPRTPRTGRGSISTAAAHRSSRSSPSPISPARAKRTCTCRRSSRRSSTSTYRTATWRRGVCAATPTSRSAGGAKRPFPRRPKSRT